ncbi:unnamed protein product [Symbiodinium natans]|uniref:Uncharacterized protein n=1 Tax=Symbiodinium natans TaxID=878477 RepID=A0A812RI48_9DINO|nr:unnamed protein product [Symbiodinium natans]
MRRAWASRGTAQDAASTAAASAALRRRVRPQRFLHEPLLRQLRLAAEAERFDPLEWRRLRGPLAEAAPQLRPAELTSALQALAALRSVEPAYLNPVLDRLNDAAGYFTPQQFSHSLTALALLGAEASCQAAPMATAIKELLAVPPFYLHQLPSSLLLDCLEALLKLKCPAASLAEVLLRELPSAWQLNKEELLRLLQLLAEVAPRIEQGAVLDMVKVAMGDARAALRGRLHGVEGLSEGELLQALMACTELQSSLELHNEPAETPQSLCSLLHRRAMQRCDTAGGRSFEKLLLTELSAGSPASPRAATALAALRPEDCARLCGVLGHFARQQRATATRSGPAVPAYVARLVPGLVRRLIELLEILSAEDMVRAWEALSADLCYSDDYLSDRLSHALAARIFPVRGEAQAAVLRRALGAAANGSSLAPFFELLQSGVEDLHACWDSREDELKEAMCRSLALDLDDLAGDRSWSWLRQMRAHFASQVQPQDSMDWILDTQAVEDLCLKWHDLRRHAAQISKSDG